MILAEKSVNFILARLRLPSLLRYKSLLGHKPLFWDDGLLPIVSVELSIEFADESPILGIGHFRYLKGLAVKEMLTSKAIFLTSRAARPSCSLRRLIL